jgi:phosphoenolpyruvate---glycerone phosphotransferase subunit DhaL
MTTFSLQQSKTFFLNAAQAFEESVEELSLLDAAIGDGDHGVSMVRGFRSVAVMISATDFADIGSQWVAVGKTLMKSIGGTCGPLFATLFIKSGTAALGLNALTVADLARMIKEGVLGIMSLGQASPGDKTMVDALMPAAQALSEAAEMNDPLAQALQTAAVSALAGAEATRGMLATKGRGRYQQENSLGHQDAGATSAAILIHALAKSALL